MVYAVCTKGNYSLVNIHPTLDSALAQVTRLDNSPVQVWLNGEEQFENAQSSNHVIQPYLVEDWNR